MSTWVYPEPDFATREYDFVELYAGHARVTRIARGVGLRSIAADVIYDDTVERSRSALNLCGNAGFSLLAIYKNTPCIFQHVNARTCTYMSCVRLAVQMIMAGDARGALLMMGIECSTFVAINKGTHRRDALLPEGDTTKRSVQEANLATSRLGQLKRAASACIQGLVRDYMFIMYIP